MHMLRKIMMVSPLLWVLTTSVAMAASYCAVFAWGKQCDYVTYAECLGAVGSQGGCEFNRNEDKPAPGTAPYCLVTPSETKCIFDEAPGCRMAASIENSEIIKRAECVENPNR
jgi:hypothetical protein